MDSECYKTAFLVLSETTLLCGCSEEKRRNSEESGIWQTASGPCMPLSQGTLHLRASTLVAPVISACCGKGILIIRTCFIMWRRGSQLLLPSTFRATFCHTAGTEASTGLVSRLLLGTHSSVLSHTHDQGRIYHSSAPSLESSSGEET